MANTSSAKKEVRKTEKRTLINKARKTRVRNLAKAVLVSKDKDQAMENLKGFEKHGMKAVSKKVFHINTIARRISRLYAWIKKNYQ